MPRRSTKEGVREFRRGVASEVREVDWQSAKRPNPADFAAKDHEFDNALLGSRSPDKTGESQPQPGSGNVAAEDFARTFRLQIGNWFKACLQTAQLLGGCGG